MSREDAAHTEGVKGAAKTRGERKRAERTIGVLMGHVGARHRGPVDDVRNGQTRHAHTQVSLAVAPNFFPTVGVSSHHGEFISLDLATHVSPGSIGPSIVRILGRFRVDSCWMQTQDLG